MQNKFYEFDGFNACGDISLVYYNKMNFDLNPTCYNIIYLTNNKMCYTLS